MAWDATQPSREDALVSAAPQTAEELKRYFEHLFANSRDMMNLFSLTHGKIIMLNKAAEESTGYSMNELSRLPVEALYPSEELPTLEIAFEQLRQTGYSSNKLRMYARSGELRDIWARAYVIQREPEAICLVHTIDMTEENRKRERELRDAKLATLGQSSATLAHELKNALQSMQFSLGTLRSQLGERELGRSASSLARVERAVAHMDEVIAAIEKTARGSSTGAAYVSLASAVENALLLMAGYLDAHAVEVATSFPPSIPPVWCDRTQVEQILIVLIKNAAQAMASRRTRKLHIALICAGEQLRIEVSDTGGGLAPEMQARVFEAFATTKPVGLGMGLGLATAKQLAMNQGFDLTFQSEPGVGATFALELAIAGNPARSSDDAQLAGRVVLVVAEDPAVLGPASSTLIDAGARVLVATSTAEGLQLLRVHSVEAVVCDDGMYPVRGREFVLAARKSYRGPVCLITDQREPGEAAGAVTGVDLVVTKPVQTDALVKVVRTLVA